MATQLSRIVADFETSLSGAVSIGDTTFTIQSATDDDNVTLSDGIYCFTLDRDNSDAKEYIVGQLTASTKVVSSISSVSRQGALTSNFQKAHRIGTNVIISDHSALNAIVKILNGTGTLDAGSPIQYDTTATISGANMLATKAYVDSVVNGGTVAYDKEILSGQTAGETLVAGNVVYLKAADSRWWKADADDSTTYDGVKLGIALGAGTAGNTISNGVQVSGVCNSFTGLTANTQYYLSSTSGGVSTSAGTPKISIGLATSTTSITLDFKGYAIPTGAQKDALAGGSTFGTPSSTNKYITEDYYDARVTNLVGYTTADTTLDNDATDTTVYTKSITGGALGANDGLFIEIFGTFNATGINETPRVQIIFDSTVIATFSVNVVNNNDPEALAFTIRCYIINNASTSAQSVIGEFVGVRSTGWFNIVDNGALSASLMTGQTRVDTTAAFDTTATFNCKVNFKNENTGVGNSFTFNGAVITKIASL